MFTVYKHCTKDCHYLIYLHSNNMRQVLVLCQFYNWIIRFAEVSLPSEGPSYFRACVLNSHYCFAYGNEYSSGQNEENEYEK